MTAEAVIAGREHWTTKDAVRLFLWEKRAGATEGPRLLDGLAADVRSSGARAAGLVGDGRVREAGV